jgi:hypothetical protein
MSEQSTENEKDFTNVSMDDAPTEKILHDAAKFIINEINK